MSTIHPSKSFSDTPFALRVERREDAAIVHLSGSCTMNQASVLTDQLVKLGSEPVKLIVIEMSRLDFIESSGLGGIVAGYLKVRRHNGEVRLVSPRPVIRNLLELTRLTQLFHVYDSLEDAARISGRTP